MKKIIQLFLTLILSCGLIRAASQDSFIKANAEYEAGHFAEAAKVYEELLKADGPRVSVLGNLGSAYFKMGENGRTILAFKQALVLQPRDPDLLANLKLAQQEATVFPANENARAGWNKFFARYSARQWSQLALGAAILVPLLALAWLFLPKKWRITLLVAGGIDVLVLALAIAALNTKDELGKIGIVVAKEATIRISPFEKAEERGTLAAGREVQLGKEAEGYIWVTSSESSLAGWLKDDEVLPLVP